MTNVYEMVRGEERIPLKATTLESAREEARRKSAELPGVWVVFENGRDVSWSRVEFQQ